MRDNKQNFHFKKNVIMQSENRILGNQLVVMSREDLDALVNEMAQNIVAAQTKNAQNDLETWMNVPEGERFLTREEVSKLLHVDFSTLWRWNKLKLLCRIKVGPRRVMYKYSDVMKKLFFCFGHGSMVRKVRKLNREGGIYDKQKVKKICMPS